MEFLTGQEILSPSPHFNLVIEDPDFFFIHHSGKRVRTDEWGKGAWESAPGTLSAIAARMIRSIPEIEDAQIHKAFPPTRQKGDGLTLKREMEELTREFVLLLVRAEILTPASPPGDFTPPVTEDESGPENPISVLVVTFNGLEHIQDCFHSLERQTRLPAEVIAVDNASEDRTVETIQRDFPQVKVIPLAKNLHFARAVNYGLKQAQTEFILVLNQDVDLAPGCIAHLQRKISTSPRAGALAPMMKFFHLRGFINGIGNHIRDSSWGSDNFIGCVDIGQFESLEEIPSACFGAVLLRKEAISSIGDLDEKYESFYEDTDWSFRCWMKGWSIVPAVEAVVYHKFGASYPDRHKLMLVTRNRMRLVLKIFRGRILAGFLRRYWTEDLKNMLALIRKGRFGEVGAYAAAYASLLLHIPNILAERRRIFKDPFRSLRERDVLAKNPAFFSCLDKEGQPVLDRHALIDYYHREFDQINA